MPQRHATLKDAYSVWNNIEQVKAVREVLGDESGDFSRHIPSQAGGILRGSRLIQVAETAGVPALLGSTIEMGPGTAAFVHLAVASKNLTVPSDLISPGLLVDNICKEPFQFQNGTLRPFEKPGLGVELDEKKMEMWQV